jgi:hypothetical protein
MNTLLDTVFDHPILLAATSLAWIFAGHGLRRIAGSAGSFVERRLSAPPGRR